MGQGRVRSEVCEEQGTVCVAGQVTVRLITPKDMYRRDRRAPSQPLDIFLFTQLCNMDIYPSLSLCVEDSREGRKLYKKGDSLSVYVCVHTL